MTSTVLRPAPRPALRPGPRPGRGPLRRTSVWLAASALAGGALLAGGGVAVADTTADVTGVVTASTGAGLPEVRVSAFRANADGSLGAAAQAVVTDASGRYTFTNLEPAAQAGTTRFLLVFTDDHAYGTDARSLPYRAVYLGGVQNARASTPVSTTPGGVTTAPTQTLARSAGLVVRVLNPAGAPLSGLATVRGYSPDTDLGYDLTATAVADTTDDDFAYDNPATPALDPQNPPADGLVVFRGLEGGAPLKLLASGQDGTGAAATTYLSQFLGGGSSFDKATVITPTSGQFQSLTIQLTSAFTPLTKPRIIGSSSFGSRLTADPGTWPLTNGTDFLYQWRRGSVVVGTGPTYTVTKADEKARIRLTVTAVRGSFVGQAVTDPTGRVGQRSKARAVRSGPDAVLVTVRPAKAKLVRKLGPATGKVVLQTTEGERASKKVRLRAGRAVVLPRGRFRGKALEAVYLGGGKLGSDTARVGGRAR